MIRRVVFGVIGAVISILVSAAVSGFVMQIVAGWLASRGVDAAWVTAIMGRPLPTAVDFANLGSIIDLGARGISSALSIIEPGVAATFQVLNHMGAIIAGGGDLFDAVVQALSDFEPVPVRL